MLGEVDLVLSAAPARRADGEHDGAEPRPSDATGSRSPSARPAERACAPALVGVAAGDPRRGLDPAAAVERPRFHRAGDVVNAEPGVDEQALAELEAVRASGPRAGPAQHHYFGGVSLIGASRRCRRSARRSGHAAHGALTRVRLGTQPT